MIRIPLPKDFDGAKFAARYGIESRKGEFFVDAEGMLNIPESLPVDLVFESPDPPKVKVTVDELVSRIESLESKVTK